MIARAAFRTVCARAGGLQIFESALAYLSVGAVTLGLPRVERALLCAMLDDRVTNIGLIGWIDIVKTYCPPPAAPVAPRGQWQFKDTTREVPSPKVAVVPDVKETFQDEMTSVIAFLWSRFGVVDRMKRSFLMDAAALVDEPKAPIVKWKDFRQWIAMWKNPEADWSGTLFDGGMYAFEGGWRQELIDKLLSGEEDWTN
jgi:hypothetical protein